MSAMHGELIACIQGTQAAIATGIGHVVIERDALAVVQAVYSDEFGILFRDASNIALVHVIK